jgi:hypothetical protein
MSKNLTFNMRDEFQDQVNELKDLIKSYECEGQFTEDEILQAVQSNPKNNQQAMDSLFTLKTSTPEGKKELDDHIKESGGLKDIADP